MMVQQSSQKDKQSSKQKREANLGQKEAGQEKEKKSEFGPSDRAVATSSTKP